MERRVRFRCKVYSACENEFEQECYVEDIWIDLDKITSHHKAEDNRCTIVYFNGFTHELLIGIDQFNELMFPKPEINLYRSQFSYS